VRLYWFRFCGEGQFSILAERRYLVSNGGWQGLNGSDAILMGVVSGSLGVFRHCHYFWGNIFSHSNLAELGKIISLAAFVGAQGPLIVRWMWF
jgi:hypothetical protein